MAPISGLTLDSMSVAWWPTYMYWHRTIEAFYKLNGNSYFNQQVAAVLNQYLRPVTAWLLVQALVHFKSQ